MVLPGFTLNVDVLDTPTPEAAVVPFILAAEKPPPGIFSVTNAEVSCDSAANPRFSSDVACAGSIDARQRARNVAWLFRVKSQ
jgi:hypothetical protein